MKLFSLTDLGNIMVGNSEILVKNKNGGWTWRGETYLDLPSLVWDVLKYLYPRVEEKGKIIEAAKIIYPGHFKCSECGECCRHISNILPDFDTGNGVCCHLDDDGRCDIYDSRPLICQVENFWEKCLKRKISKEDWYDINYESCKSLQETTHNYKP